MLIVEYDFEINEDLFIDVNNKGIGTNHVVVGSQIAYKVNEIGKFPKYENILITDSELTEPITSELSFAECIFNTGSITKELIIIGYSKKYDKLNLYQENTRIYFNKYNEPVMFSGLVDYGDKKNKMMLPTKLVVMPLNLKDK